MPTQPFSVAYASPQSSSNVLVFEFEASLPAAEAGSDNFPTGWNVIPESVFPLAKDIFLLFILRISIKEDMPAIYFVTRVKLKKKNAFPKGNQTPDLMNFALHSSALPLTQI